MSPWIESASVRGIGVALITSTCGAKPFGDHAHAVGHAEAMLLVDDDEAEIVKRDLVLEKRVRADDDVEFAAGHARRGCRLRSLPLSRPVSTAMEMPAAFEQRLKRRAVLAREQIRRRHERALQAGFGRARHGERGDQRLAGADIALQQAQHRRGLGHVGEDLLPPTARCAPVGA